MENGEWRMENGEWRMENGEWRTERQMDLWLLRDAMCAGCVWSIIFSQGEFWVKLFCSKE
jgi:hypothetical protein